MPGRLERRQADLAEVDDVAVSERREPVLGLRGRAQIDGGAGPVAQFKMAGDEVGVKVGEEDVRDAQAVCLGIRDVLVHVPLRVDHGRRVRRFVADEIRGVREAVQIELFQDHGLES